MDNLILLAQLFDGSVFLLDSSNSITHYTNSLNSKQKIDIARIIQHVNNLSIKNVYEMFMIKNGFVLRIKISEKQVILFVVFQQYNINSLTPEINLMRAMSNKHTLCKSLYAMYKEQTPPDKQILFRKLDDQLSNIKDLDEQKNNLNDISTISTNLMRAINDSDEQKFKLFLAQFIISPINVKRLSECDINRSKKNILISYVSILNRNVMLNGYPATLSFKLQSAIVKKIELSSHFTSFKKTIVDLAWLYFTEIKNFNQKQHTSTANQIKNYIDSHVHQKLTLTDIAFALTIPINNLNPVFKKKYSETIKVYIIHKKIQEATELLINTDLSISEIAEKLSFASVSHFTSSFKHIKNAHQKNIALCAASYNH